MLKVGTRLWCLVYVVLLISVSSLGLPTTSATTTLSPHTTLAPALTSDSGTATGERTRDVKRSTRFYGYFYRLMQRHSRFLSQQAFVEKMFRLFDMNADNFIERNEFRAIMQLLGFINQHY